MSIGKNSRSGWIGLGTAALLASTWAAGAETVWPGLRGPNHDGSTLTPLVDGDSVALEVGWKVALGSGYSSVVVRDGRVITMFADGDSDYLGAYDTQSGEELWRYRIGDTYAGHDGSHDGPISTPWVDENRVYGLGPYGELFAVRADNGKEVWATHLVDDHGGQKPHYGFTSSPVVAGDVLAVQIGGEGKSLAGFNINDGELLWSLGDDVINYQSPIVFDFNGEEQVVSAGPSHMIGVDAASGKVLWTYEHAGDESAMGGSSLVPIPAGNNRIFLANKVDSSAMVQVSRNGDGYSIEELWSNNTIKSSYVLPVVHQDHLYGVSGRILTCVDAATGERKWRSRDPGDGFPTLVGDHLVIITKPGTLHVVKATSESYQEVAELPLFDEHSWSAVAAVDGRLYARSMGHLARIDVTAGGAGNNAESQANWIASTGFGAFLDQLDQAGDKKAAIDAFLAKQSSFPVIEPSGAVHFLYRGEAEDVGIVGDMIGYRREDPMTRVAGTDLFYYSTILEPNAAVTYGFLPNFGDPVADPMNDQAGAGLFGEVSWFAMPAYETAAFLDEAEASKQGNIETVTWESPAYEGKSREVQVYLPAGYDAGDQRYPVVYFPAGKDALEQGHAKTALDNLIGAQVAPVIGVFIMPGDEAPRRGPDPSFGKMLVDELIPKIDADFRTLTDRMGRAVVGSGGAAQVALMTAFSHTDLFGKVAFQSATIMDPSEVANMMPAAAEKPMVVYQEWGTYHLRSPHEAWDMAESNRQLWSTFREKGYRPAGGEVPEGFGWQCWRGRTDDMLGALFPNRG